MSYRIGIDVGGTNTDAVVLDADEDVEAKAKRPTTADVTGGIGDALEAVLSDVDPAGVDHVMLGTTHCTNAVTERRGLNDVAVVRIGAPATTGAPPLYEWPDELVAAIGDHRTIVAGGHEYDGDEITALDESAAREFFESVADEVADLWRSGDRGAAADAVTDDMVQKLGVAGTPEDACSAFLDLASNPVVDRLLVDVPEGASEDMYDRTVEGLVPANL